MPHSPQPSVTSRRPEQMEDTTIALVLEPEYGAALERLVARMPVWALDSPENRAAAEHIWELNPKARRLLTVFRVTEYPVNTGEFISIVANIDLHHGGQSSKTPFRDLEVIGVSVYPDLNGALLEFGFTEITPTAAGFRATGLHKT